MMKAGVLVFAVSANAAMASDADTIFMHQRFLDAPTEWCSKDEGVPVILTSDGPDVFRNEFVRDVTPRVRVRRGSDAAEVVDVAPVEVDEIRRRRGTEVDVLNTSNYSAIDARTENLVHFGRLRFEITVCQSLWADNYGNGTWDVISDDGTILISGEIDRPPIYPEVNQFVWRGSFPKGLRLNGTTLIVKDSPNITRTTEAFASPAEGDNP